MTFRQIQQIFFFIRFRSKIIEKDINTSTQSLMINNLAVGTRTSRPVTIVIANTPGARHQSIER